MRKMNRPRKRWWRYVVNILHDYPDGTTPEESAAVSDALEETRRLKDGTDRLCVVDAVLIKGTHKIPGAALLVPCSERTAAQWHGDFIRLVGKHYRNNNGLH